MSYQLTPEQAAVNSLNWQNYNLNEAAWTGMGGGIGLPNPPSVDYGYTDPNGGSNAGSYIAGGAGGGYAGGYASGGASAGGAGGFSLNPAPTQGSGTTFGMVPGAIGAPPSIWDQTQAIPGMAANTSAETGLIGSQLAGQLSASTIQNLTNTAASRGMSLGQGGNSGLTNETLMSTMGLSQEQLQQQGSSNYMNFLGASGQQQQNPQLLADIASRNAAMAAAPNPTLAAQEAIALGQGSGHPSGGGTNPYGTGYNTTPTYSNGASGLGTLAGLGGSADSTATAMTPQIYQYLYGQPAAGSSDVTSQNYDPTQFDAWGSPDPSGNYQS